MGLFTKGQNTMPELLYLDFETYSGIDLKKVGSYAYAEHPTTEVLICTLSLIHI